MEWLANCITNYPKGVLALLGLTTILVAPGLKNSRMRPVLEGDLPATDSRVLEDQMLQSLFPDRNFYVFDLSCPEGVFTPTCLEWVRDFVSAAEDVDGVVGPVQSLVTYNYVSAVGGNVNVDALIGDNFPGTQPDYESLREQVRGDPLLFGRLVARNERSTLVWLMMSSGKSQHDVYKSLHSLMTAFTRYGKQVHAFGIHLINQELDFGISRDIATLLPFGLMFIAAIVFLTSVWQSVFLVFSVITMAVIWCFGLMGWLDIPRSVLSGSVPLILVSVVSSSSFHLIHRIRKVYCRLAGDNALVHASRKEAVGQAVHETLCRIGRPILLAGSTSSLGFATLAAFRILSIREFGWFVTVGILSGMFISLTLIPALILSVFNGVAVHRRSWLVRQFERMNTYLLEMLLSAALRHRAGVVILFGTFVMLALLGVSRVRVGSNPPHFFPPGNSVRDGFDSFDIDFGGDGFASVLFDSGAENGVLDPAFLRGVEEFQAIAEGYPRVVFGTSLVDVVKRMNRKFHNDDITFERVPEQRNLVAQYLLIYEGGAGEELAQMVDFDRRYLIVDFLADANDSAYLDRLYRDWRREAKRIFPRRHTYFGGECFLWSAQNQYIVAGKIRNVMACFLVIFICCALVFRSLVAGLIAVIPVGLATLMVFGLMGFCGITLDLANCVITSIVVGVGVDFAIHLLFSLQDVGRCENRAIDALARDAVRTAGLPISYDCLSNLAFLVFLLSAFVPVRNFGWLISFTMIVAAASTLVLIPLLVVRFRPKFLIPS